MGDITREKLYHFKKAHRQMRRVTAAFLAAATLVGCGVGWSLHQTGISATAEAFCGEVEHTHAEACYEKALTCGLEEGQTLPTQQPHTHGEGCCELQTVNVCGEEAHVHSEDCYTLRRDLTCGQEDHTNTDGCYTEVGGDLTCTIDAHTHGEDCLDDEGSLVCTKEEHTHHDGCYAPAQRVLTCAGQEHTHSETCYGEPQKVLTCTQKEHTHADSCFEEKQVLVCTLPEGPQEPQLHTHGDACYEERLTCEKEEHTHTELCLSDSTADVESPEEWKTNSGAPGTGNWAYDLYIVACAQVGYQESQRNFTLDDSGTRQGYTRYGAWYGDPYGSWNGMFVAYCLHFAGVPEDVVPQRAGVSAMLAAMAGSDRLMNPDTYAPQPGDIALFGDRVGIVAEPGETVTVICGDVDGKVEEVSVAAAGVKKFLQIAATGVWENGDAETLEGESGSSVDLKDFTTSVKLSYGDPLATVEISNTKSPTITLGDGDLVRIDINYSFPSSFSTEKATYQLPDVISTKDGLTGDVMNGSERVGSFTIENGTINITYLENAWNGETTHTGYIYFQGTADLSKTEDSAEITFPGAGKITIKKKEESKDYGHSLEKSVVKAGENQNQIFQLQDDGTVKVSYKVTLKATGTDGSGTENLVITDILNRTQWDKNKGNFLEASYDESSFKLVKSGNEEDLLKNGSITGPIFETDADGYPNAKVENLPPLAKDESYVLTYDVIIPADQFKGNDAKSVGNLVKTDDDHNAQDTSAKKEYKLQKGSSYDSGTGRITWTVTVNDSLGSSVDGWKVWDQLPENLVGKVSGNVTVTDRSGKTVATLTKGTKAFDDFFNSANGYTFGQESGNPPYKFTYETEVPDLGDAESITASNTAKLKPDDDDEITVTKEQVVSSGQWTVDKKRGDVSGDKVFWSIQAENTLGSKHFTVTDTIKDATHNPDFWNPTYYQGTHYALKEELEKAFAGDNTAEQKGLYVVLEDGTEVLWKTPGAGVTFNVTYTTAETGAVTAFQIDVTSTDKRIKGIYLSSYPTHVDFGETPEGVTWTFQNTVNIDRKSDSDSYRYTKTVDFKKQVSTDYGTTWSEENGIDEDVTLTSVSNGLLYRIILTLEEGYSGAVIVKDELPEGVEFINSGYSLYVDGVYNSNWYLNLVNYDKDKNVVTFQFMPSDVSEQHMIEIRYRVNVKDDPVWKDPLVTSKNYRNTASWGTDKKAETNTLVKRYNTDLSKEAKQLTDNSGNPSNRVQYTVVINPNKKDLADGAESFALEDTLTLPNGITGSLDPSSFSLYYFKAVGGDLDLTNRAPIIKLEWETSNPYHFKITVPNNTALVLQYVFEVNTSSTLSSSFSIQNIAQIGSQTKTNKSISFANQEAGGGLNGDKLQLVKKDADSGLLISGAMFSIRYYDKDASTWKDLWSGEISDGQIDFGISDAVSTSTTVLRPNVLYSIQETEAPKNYRLDSRPKYVIFTSETDSGSALNAATGKDSLNGTNSDSVTKNDVTLLTKSGTSTLAFTNQYTHLDVKKIWRDKNDKQIDAPVGSIHVQLMRFLPGDSANKEKVGEPVTLDESNNWSYSWANEDLGADYCYTVEEVLKDDWKLWAVSYMNNEGIQTGLITITNVVSDEFTYELPKTGGTGTLNYVFFGAFAMILAGCGLAVTRKKRDTGVNEK